MYAYYTIPRPTNETADGQQTVLTRELPYKNILCVCIMIIIMHEIHIVNIRLSSAYTVSPGSNKSAAAAYFESPSLLAVHRAWRSVPSGRKIYVYKHARERDEKCGEKNY